MYDVVFDVEEEAFIAVRVVEDTVTLDISLTVLVTEVVPLVMFDTDSDELDNEVDKLLVEVTAPGGK